MTRHLTLEGIENFRDFGDYRTVGGRRLKEGRLYRSASHGRATEADLGAIAALNLAVIVDLRRGGERLRDPSRRHAGFAGVVIAHDESAPEEEEDGWQAHIRRSDLSEASFRRYMVDYYRDAPFEPRHLDLFRRYFRALAKADGPVLIHCAAGKDRTGILAALTHHLARVHPDDILADYLLTNDPGRMARRMPILAQAIEELAGRTPSEAALRAAMGVEADYLDTAFAAIADRFGGVDAYLERALGMDAGLRGAIEARLLD
ncbi:MAG: tyrosine-protein phosphatase [Caulobacteraceae bacterium]|nr:tyrosine-protein phosphatase [Caulobacteraceae bacterium]